MTHLLNGVSLHGPLTWGRTTGNGYLAPVYDGPRYAVPVNLLAQARAAGFDFVRLTVDPGPLMALQGAGRDALDARILEVVRAIRAAGLDALVDFHPIGMVRDYSPAMIESSAFPRYLEAVRRTAALLKGEPGVAMELMNEPQAGYNPAEIGRVQEMMEALFNAVRGEAPATTVVLSGGRGGGIEGLLNLNPAPFLGQGDVRFSFHYYQPFVFTHQGVRNANPKSRIWAYAAGLAYPVTPAGFEAFWPAVERRVRADPTATRAARDEALSLGRPQLEEYFDGGGTRDAISRDFERVARWAASRGIGKKQIFVGEFGATQQTKSTAGAASLHRARWLGHVREEADRRGFRWAMWNLNGVGSMGMTLVSVDDPNALDRATLKALNKVVPVAS